MDDIKKQRIMKLNKWVQENLPMPDPEPEDFERFQKTSSACMSRAFQSHEEEVEYFYIQGAKYSVKIQFEGYPDNSMG